MGELASSCNLALCWKTRFSWKVFSDSGQVCILGVSQVGLSRVATTRLHLSDNRPVQSEICEFKYLKKMAEISQNWTEDESYRYEWSPPRPASTPFVLFSTGYIYTMYIWTKYVVKTNTFFCLPSLHISFEPSREIQSEKC